MCPCAASAVFFNDTATTEIYTLSLHDALPIWASTTSTPACAWPARKKARWKSVASALPPTRRYRKRPRSEEHTSELQSRQYLVCRLLLEKKNKQRTNTIHKSHVSLTLTLIFHM